MGKQRSTEFAEFLGDSQQRRYGALWMAGDTVFSYGVCIATVFRDRKVIHLNDQKYSSTTTVHQNAIRIGAAKAGWDLVELSRAMTPGGE